MLPTFAEIVKTTLIPGSIEFLMVGLASGVLLLYAGAPGARWGRRWLSALTVLYLVLALPVVSSALIEGLEPEVAAIDTPADARGARVLAVIGNGVVTYAAPNGAIHQFARRTAFAVLEGARLYGVINPDWVIASGGIPNPGSQHEPEAVVIRDELVKHGVPFDRIVLESASRNTESQLANLSGIVDERNLKGPIVVVTTPAHGRRVLMFARRSGLDVVLATSDALRYDSGEAGWRQFLPSVGALAGSESAMYEYLAVAYGLMSVK